MAAATVAGRSALNSAAPWLGLVESRQRVLDHQRKLHRWAKAEPVRRFDDLFNLVCDRATLRVAWDRVAHNKGARTAGVDGATRSTVERGGVEPFLEELRSSLRDGSFRPLPVRERLIPKKGGKRRLGIPTLRDRVAQMALKLVLEPIFEAEFYPSSYGYRPSRRAQDAIAEIHHFTRQPSSYEWVIEGDIKACFDTVDHQRLMELVGERVGDRKVLRLVRAFLRAGVMQEHGGFAATLMGTPQGGIASPLLANIYLSVLDRAFQAAWGTDMASPRRRSRRRHKGLATYRLVRYADDFVVLLKGTKEHAEALRDEITALVADELAMTLSIEKTHITHIDAGFDFLGFRIKRVPRQPGWSAVLTYPSKRALAAVMHKIKQATSRHTLGMRLADVLRKINPILRGWAAYFRHGVSSRTFSYLGNYAWIRMIRWIRMKQPSLIRKQVRARYYGADRIAEDGVVLYNPAKMTVERYRFRGANIDTPYTIDVSDLTNPQVRSAVYDEGVIAGRVSEQLALTLRESRGEPDA
jgi:RNA-directed DNA polymerase